MESSFTATVWNGKENGLVEAKPGDLPCDGNMQSYGRWEGIVIVIVYAKNIRFDLLCKNQQPFLQCGERFFMVVEVFTCESCKQTKGGCRK